MRDGQSEETLYDLTVDLELEPGQVAVIGCRTESPSSLGSFLFSESPADRDQRHQRLILIWASRNLNGVIGDAPKTNDRPNLFRRLVGPPQELPALSGTSSTPPPPPKAADSTAKPVRPADSKTSAKVPTTPPASNIAPTSAIAPPDSPPPPLPSNRP